MRSVERHHRHDRRDLYLHGDQCRWYGNAVATIKRDSTSPVILIGSPGADAVYTVGDAVTASYSCDDVTSGVAQCAGPVADGASVDTGSAGVMNFDGTAVDSAGNTTSLSHKYVVASAGTRIITTYVGNGSTVFGGDGEQATEAGLSRPIGVTVDAAGNVYVADRGHHVVRRIDGANGIITTVAGTANVSGLSGDGGPATEAQLSWPTGLVLDGLGNLYIADWNNSRIRKVALSSGTITTETSVSTFRVATDASGNLFYTASCRVFRRAVGSGVSVPVAGTGTCGYAGDGGPAIDAQIHATGIAVDRDGNIVLADQFNYRVRRIDAVTGIIDTIAGNGVAGASGDGGPARDAQLDGNIDVAIDDAGRVYLTDGQRIREIDASGTIRTVAGTTYGFSGDYGPATSAQLYNPGAVALDSLGNLYIADEGNHRVRRVSPESDGTPPDIIAQVTGTAGTNGWYTGDVAVTWNASDAESPVTSRTGCEDQSVTADTDGVTFTCSATSAGGTTTQSVTIKRDTTAPVVQIVTPANDASYEQDAIVNADYSCDDTLSGIASCVGPVATGAAIDTATEDAKSFTVTATDEAGNATTVTHNYTVNTAAQPVEAVNDTATTPEDQPITIAVLANDTGGDGPLSVTSVTQGANGTVSIAGTSVLYAPNAGFNGTDTFTYTASDGTASDTAIVTVTVTQNGAPVAEDDLLNRTESGVPLTIDVLSNDSDPDGDEISIQSFTEPSSGQVTEVGNKLRYSPSASGDKCSKQTDAFSYTITDGRLTDSANVAIQFDWPNQPPTAIANGPTKVYEVETVQLVGSASSDPDGDLITYRWTGRRVAPDEQVQPSWSSTAQNPVFAPPTPGTYEFTLRAADCTYPANAAGLSVPSTIQVIVEDLPDINITDASVVEGNAGSVNAVFMVTISKPSDRVITVGYTTKDGSAQAGSDYIAATGNLEFAPGTTQLALNIEVIGDTIFEPDESFMVTITPPSFLLAVSGSANGTIMNDDADPALRISLSPSPLVLSTFDQGQLTVTLGEPAGAGGTVVALQASTTNFVSIPPSVTVADGATSAQVQVFSNALPGLTNLTASADGLTPATGQIDVRLRTAALTIEDTLIGIGQETLVTLTLGEPAPTGGVSMMLEPSGSGAVALSTPSLSFLEGSTSRTLTITGASIGGFTIAASATGFATSDASAFITDKVIAISQIPDIGPGETRSLLVTLSEPAASNLLVILNSSDSSVATVPASVEIRAGQTQPLINPLVTGVGVGIARISASASGFAADSATLKVVLQSTFQPATVNVNALRSAAMTLRVSAPAPTDGLVFDLVSDDLSIATVAPAQVTIPQGQLSAQVTVTGVASGATTVHANPTGSSPASPSSAAVTVGAPARLCVTNIGCNQPSIDLRIGADLQSGIGFYLDVAPELATTVQIEGSSDNPNVLVSTVENAGGAATASRTGIADTSTQAFWLQALGSAQGSTANVAFHADGYADTVVTVHVDPSGFAMTLADLATDVGADNTAISLYALRLTDGALAFAERQELRGGLIVPVQFSNSSTAVGEIKPSTVQAQTVANGLSTVDAVGVAVFDPNNQGSGGTTTVAVVTPAGFETLADDTYYDHRESVVTVNAPKICWYPYGCSLDGSTIRIGADLQVGERLYLESAPANPVAITAESGSSDVVRVSNDWFVPGGVSASSKNLLSTTGQVGEFVLQALGTAQGQSTTVTFRASGYADAVVTIEVDPSGFAMSLADTTTNTAADNTAFDVHAVRLDAGTNTVAERQDLRAGLEVPVEITSSNTAVGTVVPSTINARTMVDYFNYYDYRSLYVGQVAFDPNNQGSGGTTTVAVVTPAGFETLVDDTYYDHRESVVTVNAPKICWYPYGCSLDGSTIRIGADLQVGERLYLESAPANPVAITAESGSSDVVRVSNDWFVPGGVSASSKNLLSTTGQVGEFVLQALGTAQGQSTTVTFRASGYADAVVTIEVDPSGFAMSLADTTTNTAADNTAFDVHAVRLDAGTNTVAERQDLRAGLEVPVEITSSNTAVGTVVPSTINARTMVDYFNYYDYRSLYVGQVAFDPNNQGSGGTTTVAVVTPAGFETLVDDTYYDHRESVVTVNAPKICWYPYGCSLDGSTIRIGADLQVGERLYLESAPANPVAITAESGSSDVVRVSNDWFVPGGVSASSKNLLSTTGQVGEFVLQALGTAQGQSTTVTFRASGYADAVVTIEVDPSGFAMSLADTTTNTAADNTAFDVHAVRLDAGTNTVAERQDLRAGLEVPVEITSSNTAVGTVVPSTINARTMVDYFNYYDYRSLYVGQVAFDPNNQGSGGTTTVAVVTPAGFETLADDTYYDHRESVVTVTQPRVWVQGTYAAYTARVGEDLQIKVGVALEIPPNQVGPNSSVDVIATSDNFGVVVVSNGEVIGGSGSVAIPVSSTNIVYFWVHGLQQGSSATVTFSAEGYKEFPLAIEVDPSGFVTTTADFSRATTQSDVAIVVRAARLERVTNAYQEDQEIRGGYTASVNVTTDMPTVGVISSAVPLYVEPVADDVVSDAGLALFRPLSVGQTVIEIKPPTGWDTPKSGTYSDRFVVATVPQ